MSEENVHALYAPDPEAMTAHLEHLFGGFLDGFQDGLIELAWTDTTAKDGRYPLRHARLFGTDDIDGMVTEAVRLNSMPMCNVYVGAALRHPDTPPFARTTDHDFLALTCGYADLDDDGVAATAKDRFTDAKPTMVVVTGTEPYTRAQMWWRLDEPISDPVLSEGLLRGVARVLRGDPSVVNPGRVMRLAGSIAWPMKPDRKRPEVTCIRPLRAPGQPVYAYGHLARAFPPVYGGDPNAGVDTSTRARAAAPTVEDDGLVRTVTDLGLPGAVHDHRERHMRDTVAAVLIQLVGETGKVPTPQELFAAGWDQYARSTDLTKPGRGKDEYVAKCAYTVRRFTAGKIRGCRTIAEAQAVYRRKQQARAGLEQIRQQGRQDWARDFPTQAPPEVDPATGQPVPLLLTSKQFVDGFTPPSYLVDGVIQRGYLYSITARTGHGKTAVALYIAQCIARNHAMHGCPVRGGTVLFCAGENPDDIRARFLVLAQAYGFDPEAIKIRFIAGVISLHDRMQQIRQEAALIDDLVLVIVDTAAAYFPGDETNSNSQQGAYARLLRELTFLLPAKPAAIICCHPVKNASKDNLIPMGGSAFLNEVDGNLTLWANTEKQTSLHWQGKFRGPEFNPIAFEMVEAMSERVMDAEGRLMPSVVARPMSDEEVEASETAAETAEDQLLRALYSSPRLSLAKLGFKLGWSKRRVQVIMDRLAAHKLVAQVRSRQYEISEKGKDVLGVAKPLKKGEPNDFG